jgi:hypothetical protein
MINSSVENIFPTLASESTHDWKHTVGFSFLKLKVAHRLNEKLVCIQSFSSLLKQVIEKQV